MKTTNLTQNSSSTHWSLSQEDEPRPAGEQAATSASASEQRLARQPAKRPRVEQDEPGMAPQRREPLSVNLHNAAGSSGELNGAPSNGRPVICVGAMMLPTDAVGCPSRARTGCLPTQARHRVVCHTNQRLDWSRRQKILAWPNKVPGEEASGCEKGKNRLGRYSGQDMRRG